jgi:hypothetical protein
MAIFGYAFGCMGLIDQKPNGGVVEASQGKTFTIYGLKLLDT